MDEMEMIRTAFLEQYKDKIEKYDTLRDYFNSYTKGELVRIISLASTTNKKFLSKLFVLDGLKKEETLKYMLDNYEEIYSILIENIDYEEIKEFKKTLSKLDNNIIKLGANYKDNYKLSLIKNIGFLNLGKINYAKREDELTIMIPNEIKNLIINRLNDRLVCEKIRKLTELKKNTEIILQTYGIIPESLFLKIIQKEFKELYNEDILDNLFRLSLVNENINIINLDKDRLIYNISFGDEDKAIDFYNSLNTKNEYKIYTRKEYKDFYDFSLINNLSDYKQLRSFLMERYLMNYNDVINFKNFYIEDYIFSYQLDEEVAKCNLHRNIHKIFIDLSFNDEMVITNYISKIAKYYPRYILKGNTVNSIELKKNK